MFLSEDGAMAKKLVAFGALLLIATGCDVPERVSRLEKQTKELRADVDKNRAELDRSRAAADLDSQAKCSKDARAWFNESWFRDKDTLLLTYTNHYNKSSNKCFILVEFHYSLNVGSSWANSMALWDVYENSKYATFGENHMVTWKPKYEATNDVILCELVNEKCKTLQEFNKLVSPYLNN
jgi:hypothetical protein